MDAALWVSLFFALSATQASPRLRISRDTGTGTGTPRFRPSFGPPVQPRFAGTTYPVHAQAGTTYPVHAQADSPYPVHSQYSGTAQTNERTYPGQSYAGTTYSAFKVPAEATYPVSFPAHGGHQPQHGQDGDFLEHTTGFDLAIAGPQTLDHQGFVGAWGSPPPHPPLSIGHRFVPPPPPPPKTGESSTGGREFHSVVNYGSISIHHGAHFEPHHNAKQAREGKAVVEVLPVKSADPGKEVETITTKTPPMVVAEDDKEELKEETMEAEIIENSASREEKI